MVGSGSPRKNKRTINNNNLSLACGRCEPNHSPQYKNGVIVEQYIHFSLYLHYVTLGLTLPCK